MDRSAPPDRRQPARPARPHDRGAARDRVGAALGPGARATPRTTSPNASRRRSALVGERYQEGRSGIVLEQVAGGWAFRAVA